MQAISQACAGGLMYFGMGKRYGNDMHTLKRVGTGRPPYDGIGQRCMQT